MLHITSLMQNLAKLNNPPTKLTSDRETYLNALNRNYSFVFDNYSNKLTFNYYDTDERENEHEQGSRGYWGYMRDKQADQQKRRQQQQQQQQQQNHHHNNRYHKHKHSSVPSSSTSSLDSSCSSIVDTQVVPTTSAASSRCYWGLFVDELVEETDEIIRKQEQQQLKTPSDIQKDDDQNEDESNDDSFEDFYPPKTNKLNHDLSNISNVESPSSLATKLIYDYKRSQFKIEAGKRDQMKVYMQQLHEEEEKMRKDSFKLFREETPSDLDTLKTIRILYFSNSTKQTNKNSNNNEQQELKQEQQPTSGGRMKNFQRSFDTLKQLNKPITIFNMDQIWSENSTNNNNSNSSSRPSLNGFFPSVDLSVGDFLQQAASGFTHHRLAAASPSSGLVGRHRSTSAVSLCSNLGFKQQQQQQQQRSQVTSPFSSPTQAAVRPDSHSTLIFEHSGIKLGFIALFDKAFCINKLRSKFIHHVYRDFVDEASQLSQQLRACGVSLVIAVTNFDDAQSESRLVAECGTALDLILSSSNVVGGDLFKVNAASTTHTADQQTPASTSSQASAQDAQTEAELGAVSNANTITTTLPVPTNNSPSVHLLKFESNSFEFLYLLTLRVDLSGSAKLAHIDVDKYYVD